VGGAKNSAAAENCEFSQANRKWVESALFSG
jgi:hypothetical protein